MMDVPATPPVSLPDNADEETRVEDERYACPICGFGGLWEDPALRLYNICPQCGIEFGADDISISHATLRERWISAGRPFWSTEAKISRQWLEWYDLHMFPDDTYAAQRLSLIAAASGTLTHQGVRYAVTWDACPWCGALEAA